MRHPRRSLAQRAALVQQWKASGLSAFAFAKLHGFAPQNLSRWAANLPSTTTSTALSFVRLEAAPRLAAPLVLEVGLARVRVETGFDPALLRAVVSALAGVAS